MIQNPEEYNKPIDKTLIKLYESSIIHCRIDVLRNVLYGIILMELIPPNKPLTDMCAFLKSKGSVS